MTLGVGSPFPKVMGLDFVKGGPVTLGAPGNNVFVVEFWATW